MKNRIVLITGANKGIGEATARALSEKGLEIIIGSRDVAAGEAVAKMLPRARVLKLDVTDEASVRAAASQLDRLDILVNNSGITHPDDAAPSTAKLAGLRAIFDVNFFGAVTVTQAFLPLLRASSAGRIVNVSSELGSLALVAPPDSPYKLPTLGYKASKAALGMLTVELARELRGTNIKVNAAAPGYTPTDLNRHLGVRPNSQTVDDAAKVIVKLSLLPDDGPTGRFFSNHGEVQF